MKIFKEMKGSIAVGETASRFGETTDHVRQDMQAALDAAWDTDDLAAMKLQREFFPDGKPTLEQFIVIIAKYIKSKRN